MPEPHKREPTLTPAFTSRVAELTPDAWERIHERCAALDSRTLEGVLNRLELFARAMPDSDPYKDPLTRPVMAMIGRFLGFGFMVSDLLWRLDPKGLQRTMDRAANQPADPRMPGFDHFMRLEMIVKRHDRNHPGTAAALRAVGFGLAWHRTIGPAFTALYQPFEPEIPFDSLKPAA